MRSCVVTGMFSKPLGGTSVVLPEIGFGTWQYTGGVEVLRRAVDAGVVLIDTAESYGSEPVVGQAVRGIRDKVFVATKVSPEHFRPEALRRSADASLQRLGLDQIDLYQLHEPSVAVPLAETLGAMEELVDAGKVRFLGVSNFSADELAEAQKLVRRHRIVANQVRYSLVDRTIERELLPYCRAQNVTVIAYSPFARGGVPAILECDPEGVLSRVAEEAGKTLAQVCLNWVADQPGVVAIPKTCSGGHAVENCRASGWHLSPAQRTVLEQRVRFRCRSRFEVLVRRYTPRSWKRLARGALAHLPAVVRRRLN